MLRFAIVNFSVMFTKFQSYSFWHIHSVIFILSCKYSSFLFINYDNFNNFITQICPKTFVKFTLPNQHAQSSKQVITSILYFRSKNLLVETLGCPINFHCLLFVHFPQLDVNYFYLGSDDQSKNWKICLWVHF